jgi:chromosome segregation ATPase
LQEQQTASDADDLSLGHKSTSGSGESILETLEEMKEKAEETLSGVRMTEMKAGHNYQMMVQSLTDAVELGKSKVSDAKSLKATLAQTSGKAKGELELTQKGKMADTVFLSTLKTECETAAKEFAEKETTSKGEMAAIEKAKSILSEKVKVFFVQTAERDPFADDASTDDEKRAAVRAHLVADLKALSHKVSSFAMMELASSASQDPFEKVKGLITDMIAKLVSEANAEATQKAFCDEETAKSKKEMAEKSMRSDELNSRLDTAAASKGTLLQSIKDLTEEIADMDAKTSESTKLRAEEHATYLKASADFKMAAKAVEDAIRVLKEFYAGSGTTSDASATICGILETSGAEFTKMYMEVETTETEAVSAFKKMSDEDKVTKAAKEAEIKGAESEIKSLDVSIQNSGEDIKMVTKELDAVMSYLDKLKPQCETKAMTYEEKKAKREAEIEGLKEALALLAAPELLQVSQLRGTKRH